MIVADESVTLVTVRDETSIALSPDSRLKLYPSTIVRITKKPAIKRAILFFRNLIFLKCFFNGSRAIFLKLYLEV
jgi:hypothetical protein